MPSSLIPHSRLFRKYALYFIVLMTVTVLTSGLSGLFFAYQENRTALLRLQREKAVGAASKIEQFVAEVEHQMGWTHLPRQVVDAPLSDQRYEHLKLLRQVPAITEVRKLDGNGRERLFVSRVKPDAIDSAADLSRSPGFVNTRVGQTYFGPVYFRKHTEPYLTIAMVGSPPERGATIAEVNLKFVWEVVSRIKVGQAGGAYVVDREGQLVSHPDLSLVLKKVDFSHLPQVSDALAALRESTDERAGEAVTAHDRGGSPVLTAYARIPILGWVVFVEQPRSEAFAPLRSVVIRSAVLLLIGLVLAVTAGLLLARRMTTPITALRVGADRIGTGELEHRITVSTGDEFEELADQFNLMAEHLQRSHSDLEGKVEERTRQLELASQSKSKFFAAASHDLRQPMHALGLLVAQLKNPKLDAARSQEIVEQAEASVEALGNLLDALLDISKLDAGVLTPNVETFPIDDLLKRMDFDFASTAAGKGIGLRIVHSRLAVESDPVLLERILLNLVANAIRYTQRGRILLGCRRSGTALRIEVWDTGPGIPADRQEEIFTEFVQLENPERDRSKGLGLGLAIVRRLADLLGHRVTLSSTPGRGSRFAVEVPRRTLHARPAAVVPRELIDDNLPGAFVLVVDDDALVQKGMEGLLTGWGCHVVTAATSEDALAELENYDRIPDAFICDYRLPGETGIEAIHRLRSEAYGEVPAALISGETSPELIRKAREVGHPLLRKPVQPAKVRALLRRMIARELGL